MSRTPRNRTDKLGTATDRLRNLLGAAGLFGLAELPPGRWTQWNLKRLALARRFWAGWLAWLTGKVPQDEALALVDRLASRWGVLLAEHAVKAELADEVAAWPTLQLSPSWTLHAHAPAEVDAGGPWTLDRIEQETGYDQVLVHLFLTTRPAAHGGHSLGLAVETALQALRVRLPEQAGWQRKLAQWLATPPTPIWLHPNLRAVAQEALLGCFWPLFPDGNDPTQIAAARQGLGLWQRWLAELAATDAEVLAEERASSRDTARWTAQWWVDFASLPATLRSELAKACPEAQATGVVRTEFLEPALAAAVADVARTRREAPVAIVARADAARALPALARLLGCENLQLPKLRGAYWDPPYNTGSRAFGYRDKRTDTVWQAQLRQVSAALAPLVADDGWLTTSMGQGGEPALRDVLDATPDAWQRRATVQVIARHAGRVLSADREIHEVTEALSFWQRGPDARLARQKLPRQHDEHVWQIHCSAPPQELLRVGEREVRLWPPQLVTLQRVEADAGALKRISIRGGLREANSSGRLYVAALEPLRDTHAGWFAWVPDLGDDGLGGRWFEFPSRADLRNGCYYQGVASGGRHEVVSDCWDFVTAYNQVDREGGVRYRNGKKPLALLERVLSLQGAREQLDGWWLDPMAGSGSCGEALWRLRQETGGQQTAVLIERGAAATEVLAPRLVHMLQQTHQPFRLLWLTCREDASPHPAAG